MLRSESEREVFKTGRETSEKLANGSGLHAMPHPRVQGVGSWQREEVGAPAGISCRQRGSEDTGVESQEAGCQGNSVGGDSWRGAPFWGALKQRMELPVSPGGTLKNRRG